MRRSPPIDAALPEFPFHVQRLRGERIQDIAAIRRHQSVLARDVKMLLEWPETAPGAEERRIKGRVRNILRVLRQLGGQRDHVPLLVKDLLDELRNHSHPRTRSGS